MQMLAQRALQRETVPDIPDEEVIGRVLAGEKELYEVIMRRYNQRLFRIGRSYVKSEDEVEEIMQQAYVRAYEALPGFRNESSFSTWLTRILINEALAALNRRNRLTPLPAENREIGSLRPGNPLSSAESDNPIRKVMNDELRTVLEEAIDGLPPNLRSVYILREIEQMTTAETAGCLGISEANVKVRLSRAKSLLRDAIGKVYREAGILEFHASRCNRIVSAVLSRVQRY